MISRLVEYPGHPCSNWHCRWYELHGGAWSANLAPPNVQVGYHHPQPGMYHRKIPQSGQPLVEDKPEVGKADMGKPEVGKLDVSKLEVGKLEER